MASEEHVSRDLPTAYRQGLTLHEEVLQDNATAAQEVYNALAGAHAEIQRRMRKKKKLQAEAEATRLKAKRRALVGGEEEVNCLFEGWLSLPFMRLLQLG